MKKEQIGQNTEINTNKVPENRKTSEFRGILEKAKTYALVTATALLANDILGQSPTTAPTMTENTNSNFPTDSLIFNTVQAVGNDSLENNSTAIERDTRFWKENEFCQRANQADSRLQNIMKRTIYRKLPLVQNGDIGDNLDTMRNYINAHPSEFPLEDVVNFLAYGIGQAGKYAETFSGHKVAVTLGNLVHGTSNMNNTYHEEAHDTLIHSDGLNNVEESIFNSSGGLIQTVYNAATIMDNTLSANGQGRNYFSLNPLYNTGMIANGGTGEFVRELAGFTFKIPATSLNKTPLSSTDKLAAYNTANPEVLHKEFVPAPVSPIIAIDHASGMIYVANPVDFANFYNSVFHRDTNGVISPATSGVYGTDEIYRWFPFDAANPANSVFPNGVALGDSIHLDSLNNITEDDNLQAAMRSYFSNGKSSLGAAISLDISSPIATITANEISPTNANTIEITFNFANEDSIQNFTQSDLILTGPANFAGFTQISPTEYKATLNTTGSGTVNLDLPADVCTDEHGNQNEANSFSIEVDKENPQITLSAVKYHTNQTANTVTFSTSETTSALASASISADNAASITNLAGNSFDVNLPNEGITSINISAGAVTDLANNPSLASEISFKADFTNPQILADDTIELAVNQNCSTTATFDDLANATDLNLKNTTISETIFNLGYTTSIATATDSAGNQTTQNIVINALDETAPTISAKTLILNLNYSDKTVTAQQLANINDNCTLDQTLIEGQANITITAAGNYTKTVSATDQSGNLTEKDIDFIATKTVGIEDLENSIGIKIYPNPTKNDVSISIKNKNVLSVSIINLLGEKLLSKQGKKGLTVYRFDTEHLANGVYKVLVEDNQGHIGIGRLLVF